MYWSLQYLSVADATVLVFLTPLTTAVAGTVFLKESYSIKQAVAGGESYNLPLMVHDYLWSFQPSFQFTRCCPHRQARVPIWLTRSYSSRIPRRGPWAKAGGRWVGTIHITSRSTHNLSISGRACMVSVLGNTGACTYCARPSRGNDRFNGLYRYLHSRNREACSPNACNDILFIMVHNHIIFGVGQFISPFYVSIHCLR
jgi:hypothetical protein